MLSYSAGFSPTIRVSTHSAYGFAPRARSAAWADVRACALLLAAFALVIGGMTAAGLR